MVLPNELHSIIQNSISEIQQNEKGELVLSSRKIIWTFFGEFKIGERYRALITLGLKRRIKLSILCIEKVIEAWERDMPDDDSIRTAITMIERYIDGKLDGEEIRLFINKNATKFEDLNNKYGLQMASAVGFITIKAMGRALSDEELIIYNKEDAVDLDYDCYDLDVAYYAAVIYANGGPWDPQSSIEKRQEFWIWYVNEAVPKAYLSYKE